MKHPRLRPLSWSFLVVALIGLMGGCARTSPAPLPPHKDFGARSELPWFNQVVLDIIDTYPTDGTHGYWWPRAGESSYDGVTSDLYLLGQRVLRGEEGGNTYCCGLTLEVFLKAYNEWLALQSEGTEPPLGVGQWREFQRDWFVRRTNGPGPSLALGNLGIGTDIPAGDVLPGDFVQIWRTANDRGVNTGHSVIFLDWVRDHRDRPIGMLYWSTQTSTGGINENVEYFGMHGNMSTENTHYGRVTLADPRG